MVAENYIKSKIQRLYEERPNIHLSANMPKYPLKLNNVEAKIVGAYAHIFGVELVQNGIERRYFFQYGEVITHNVNIAEINMI